MHEHLVQQQSAALLLLAPEREQPEPWVIAQPALRQSRVLPATIRRDVRILVHQRNHLETGLPVERVTDRANHRTAAEILVFDVQQFARGADTLEHGVENLDVAAGMAR